MTDNPHLFEAKKDGLRQTQDGLWKLTLTVLPHDMPPWLLSAPMGQLIGASGLHEIHDHAADEPKPEKRHDAQHCAALCDKDVAWRQYIRARAAGAPGDEFKAYPDDGQEACVERVYCLLGIASRSQINTDDRVNEEWHRLLAAFKTATGRSWEARI